MNYKETTMIPNIFFDTYLKSLSEKEIKVLLVILRQTIGWVNKNGQRKNRDWISQRYYMNKTGLSRKSVSKAISILIQKKIIVAESKSGTPLPAGKDRKAASRIYYSCVLSLWVKITHTKKPIGKIYLRDGKKLLTTKLTQTKLSIHQKKKSINKIKKISDLERYHQIINSPSDSNS